MIFGRGDELLKTTSMGISLHFPEYEDLLVFSELINNSRIRPDILRGLYLHLKF
jgi:hypothetical protein